MARVNLKGLGVAMITPFSADLQVNYAQLEKLTEHIIAGADYLVVCGTTAETPTLTSKEKKDVLACIKKVNNGRLPIVYGAGGNNTLKAIKEIKEARDMGVDAILSVVPYYNKPTDAGIYAHFAAIAGSTDLPIILYNIPGRTVVNMPAEVTLQLAREFDNIVAVKEASGDLEQMKQLIAGRPADFLVISGDDGITLDLLKAGGDGVISVLGNAYAREWGEMVRAGLQHQWEVAASISTRFQKMNEFLFLDGNPAGIKAAVAELGLIDNYLRLPMVPATPETVALIKGEM